jgi:hypothetical protein
VRWLAALAVVAVAATAAAPGGPSSAGARTAPRTPIEERTGLRPGLQLAAMRTAIAAAPTFYENFEARCSRTVPVIAFVDGRVMAGNFRDTAGACYVWLNLGQAPLLTGQEICKTTLHEMGHLTGLQHSADPDDIMYAPFRAQPLPQPCVSPLPGH